MRKIVFATLIAAGLGFVGWSTASAAPAAGTAIHESSQQVTPVVKVQHWWRRSRWHRRNRCHYRRWSRWGYC
jgi:hypothetical protein